MKVINLVLGLGTAIILSALITLGIKAFYPEPQYPTQNVPVTYPAQMCTSDTTQCLAQQTAADKAQQIAQDKLNEQQNV
jgi:hypothetical protein